MRNQSPCLVWVMISIPKWSYFNSSTIPNTPRYGEFQSQNGLILTQTGHICCKQFHTFQSQNGLILTHLYDEDKCSSCVISIPKWSYFNLLMRTVTLSTRQISIPKWSYFNSTQLFCERVLWHDFNPKMVLF